LSKAALASGLPSFPLVTVWSTLSLFLKVTVVPTFTVRLVGLKANPDRVTVFPPLLDWAEDDGLVVQATNARLRAATKSIGRTEIVRRAAGCIGYCSFREGNEWAGEAAHRSCSRTRCHAGSPRSVSGVMPIRGTVGGGRMVRGLPFREPASASMPQTTIYASPRSVGAPEQLPPA